MNLSQQVMRWRELMQQVDQQYADLALFFAPSECYADVMEDVARLARRLLVTWGYKNYDAFYKAVADRTNDKWAYYNLEDLTL